MAERTHAQAARPTADDVRKIVGQIDDERLAAILATGATTAQIVEAFTWLSSDDYLGADLERSLSGPVAEVYEILKSEEIDLDEERPRTA
jgi:hypothetical protein